MNARHFRLALAGAALLSLPASPVFAVGPSPEPSAFALPASTLAITVTPTVADVAPEVNTIHVSAVPEVAFAGVHYRPHSTGSRRAGYGSSTALYLGFFDPEGTPDAAFLSGIRGGPMISPNVQIGGLFEWVHDSQQSSSFVTQGIGPGGTPVTVYHDYTSVSTDMFPFMAYMQVSGNENMALVPYVGIAGGYEWLNVSDHDYYYTSGYGYGDATYSGWAWQAWGGLGLPLSGRTRLTGEAFYHWAELGRDVYDPYWDYAYRETVDRDGFGARFGLAWGF